MASKRSLRRNVHFQFKGDEEPFGGMELLTPNKITNSQLFRFLEILVVPHIEDDKIAELCAEDTCVYQVFLEQVEIVANKDCMRTGTYFVIPHPRLGESVKLKKTNDGLVPRAFSHSISGSTSAFKEAVRERDEGCAIFNAVNKLKRDGEWKAFEAAHIFPLERGSDFAAMGGDRWITDCDGESVAAKLNSPQNGMILHSSIDKHFDSFTVGIDVDDGYKVVLFRESDFVVESCNGNTLAKWARQNGDVGVRDELLRWHLRMCVLANMRGAGEPTWDYEDADDNAGAVLSEDPSGERFALEVSSRLAHQGYTCVY